MPKIETYPEPLAQIYDQVMGYFDYSNSAKIVEDIVQQYLGDSVKPSILELGIGTGALALELIALGYPVEGIDHSHAMLSRAREKGLPQNSLHNHDVKDFSLDHHFGVIVSHAGPLRIDYTHERGYFFETFLASEREVIVALNNISNHLMHSGIFLMGVQSAPGRDYKTRSTSEYIKLEDGYEATKVITEQGNVRIKRREVKKDGRVLVSIEHRFRVLDLERFDKLALRYGLQDRGLDPTQHFHVYIKAQE